MNAIRETTKESIEWVGMPTAKFLSPLTPGEPLTIRWDQHADRTTAFTCTTGSRLIASGCLRYRIIADEPAGDS